MDLDDVLDKLLEECVAVWLDGEGKLRIDCRASEELKKAVRAHKEQLIEIQKAQVIMNRPGMRSIRLPLGQMAVAYPLGANLAEIRWAMRVLRMGAMPLVINDEELQWIPCR